MESPISFGNPNHGEANTGIQTGKIRRIARVLGHMGSQVQLRKAKKGSGSPSCGKPKGNHRVRKPKGAKSTNGKWPKHANQENNK